MTKDPETLRAERRERELAERRVDATARESARVLTANILIGAGVLAVLAGAWFLLTPSVDGNVVNVYRLTVGQTLTLAGVVAAVGGLLIRTREPIRPPVP